MLLVSLHRPVHALDLVYLTVLAVALLALGPMLFGVLERGSVADMTPQPLQDTAAETTSTAVGATPRVLLVLVLLVAATTASALTATPATLPAVAMGSEALLHLQRGALALALLGTAILVGLRATRGEFPLKFGPWLEYADKAATEQAREETTVALGQQQALIEKHHQESLGRFGGIELSLESLNRERIEPLGRELAELTARIGELRGSDGA